MDTAGKLSAARSVLMQAETAVGLNVSRSLDRHDSEWDHLARWDVPAPLQEVFPAGLAQGITIGVHGSRLTSMLLAGVASSQGAWVACLGIPDMSWGMAGILGMNLEHTVCVPDCPGPMLTQAISAAIDGFDVVLVGPSILERRDTRVLARRALSRRTLLLGEGWHARSHADGTLVDIGGAGRGGGHISSLTLRLSTDSSDTSSLIEITGQGWQAAETIDRGLHAVSRLEVVGS
ncbi:MAG: hypothetical protein ACTHW1_03600 [Ancrocorticia sp.]|uniref:hypothetical protein n=1 Tax=Ancrocorticia sp. TaxID=2593684 RepID=UPI003F9037B8